MRVPHLVTSPHHSAPNPPARISLTGVLFIVAVGCGGESGQRERATAAGGADPANAVGEAGRPSGTSAGWGGATGESTTNADGQSTASGSTASAGRSGMGGTSTLGGDAGRGGDAGGGTAGTGSTHPPWDGWMVLEIGQMTECVGPGQPLEVAVSVDQSAQSLLVVGVRTVVATSEGSSCLPNYEGSDCVVAEEFSTVLTGDGAAELMAGFSYLPNAACTNDGQECEMPCSAATLRTDGGDRRSLVCCGVFDEPEFPMRAIATITKLMGMVAAELASQ